jgi:hypothetical protein
MSEDESQQLEQLMLILAPENVESTKLWNYLNENLEAYLADLLSINEISKITTDKETLINLLTKLPYIEYSKDKENSVKIIINSELSIFSLVNLPFTITEDNLKDNISILKENSQSIDRLYKKSIFWNIATENLEVATKLEDYLKTAEIKVANNSHKVVYERTNGDDIRKNILKQISNHTYNKESCGLQKKGVQPNNDYNSANSQKLSWRKKSNDTTEQMGRIGGKASTFQRGGVIRDRYNSDGQQHAFKPKPKYEEIEIDLSKINYSLKLKHKFTNGDLLLYYDKFRINKIFDVQPKFENFIEEICSTTKRKEFNFLKRERSLTYSLPVTYRNSKFDDIKLNLDAPSFKLPTQNPISAGKLGNIQINK